MKIFSFTRSLGAAFTIIQPDFGTSPTASGSNDTLTITSTNGTMDRIEGNASTDTLELSAGVGSRYRTHIRDDLNNVTPGMMNWVSSATGGAIQATTSFTQTNGRMGVARFTATANTCNCQHYVFNPFRLGMGEVIWKGWFKIDQAGTVSDPHTTYFGIQSATTIGASSQMVAIKHLYSENSGNFTVICQTASSNVSTVNTNVTMTAGKWYFGEIIVNAGRTEITAYINGTLVATFTDTAYMPATNVDMYFMMAITKSAHSGNTISYLDYAELYVNYTAGQRPEIGA